MLDYHYVTFLTVCQTKSYTEAAQRLNLTQPAVSKHIAQLQEMLGVTLFVYKQKHLFLTEAGEQLYRLASHIQKESELGLQQLTDTDLPLEMTISCTLTIGNFLIGTAMARLLEKYPNLKLNLLVENTDHLVHQLIHDQIDAAFVEGDFDKNFFQYHKFREEQLIGVCSPQSPLANRLVSWEEIAQYSLINREPGSGQGKIVEKELVKKGVPVHLMPQRYAASYSVIKEFVMRDLGIAFLYQSTVEDELKNQQLVALQMESTLPKEDMYFIYLHKNAVVERILENFSLFESSSPDEIR